MRSKRSVGEYRLTTPFLLSKHAGSLRDNHLTEFRYRVESFQLKEVWPEQKETKHDTAFDGSYIVKALFVDIPVLCVFFSFIMDYLHMERIF